MSLLRVTALLVAEACLSMIYFLLRVAFVLVFSYQHLPFLTLSQVTSLKIIKPCKSVSHIQNEESNEIE